MQEGEKAVRKISQMRSAFDQDKQVLQKEKARNQELLSQIGQLTKKMKRMQAQVDVPHSS